MIVLNKVTIIQGGFSLHHLSMTVPAGAYGVLMGSTGCGKTTVLEAILGLRPIALGSITVDGRLVAFRSLCEGGTLRQRWKWWRQQIQRDPAGRGIGYVPQDGAMFPTMNVAQQLAFPLEIRRVGRKQRNQAVSTVAEELGISHLLKRLPQGLSGGERQRVALGRALVAGVQVLVLDEPLAALDEDRREEMCSLLKRLHYERHLTVLHITHARQEAERLATHRFHFANGGITQDHPPLHEESSL